MNLSNFKFGFILVLTIFLNACASLVLPERSEFHQAALMGNPGEVRRLLPTVANIDAYDSSGFAAIHWAATTSTGQPVEVLKVLLQAGSNPNLPQSSAKMTPLFFATSSEVVNVLVDAGADVEYRAIDKSTPLHHAKTVEVVHALLAKGADKNAINISGNTPKAGFEALLPYIEKNPSLAAAVEGYKARIAALGGTDTSQKNQKINGFHQSSLKVESQAVPDLDNLIAAQACPMASDTWVYTGELCVNGLAHGQGSAQHYQSSWRFEGVIESGLPIDGVLYENDTEIYEGVFKEGVAHGNGVCYFEGLPEECRYFKGQRIDTLHKQRLEFDRQQTLANKASKRQPVVTRQVVQQPAERNTLGDAVGDELLEQGAKFIFDKLF